MPVFAISGAIDLIINNKSAMLEYCGVISAKLA